MAIEFFSNTGANDNQYIIDIREGIMACHTLELYFKKLIIHD